MASAIVAKMFAGYRISDSIQLSRRLK